MEDYVNQLEGVPSSPPEEVPVNQSSMLCNDRGGQNMLVDNDVINDSFQQTTPFPPSFPQTMMEGAPPSSGEDDNVSFTWNQLEIDKLMSELRWSPPEEVPVNQSSISCNDRGGQNMLVDNDVINDSFQQTTQFPPSFPQTMMEGVPPSSMDDAANQLEFETFNMSELSWSPAEEVPVNQSSMLCNDQAGQNMLVDDNVINDTIQQTTWFPPSFPQTMMEGAPPFFVDDNVSLTSNQLDTLMSELPPSFSQTMTTMGGLDGASSSWINQNGPDWPQTPSSYQQWTNQLPMSNQVPGMLPQPPMSQCSQQFPYQFNQVLITPYPYDPQSSTMLPESSQTFRHQNSFIHQPQQGYVYMTPNATTSQHGGFNQPPPRYPIFHV